MGRFQAIDAVVLGVYLVGTTVLGIWAGASRRRVVVQEQDRKQGSGPWTQVSRLGNPLFNEVVVAVGDKDRWNAVDPINDKNFQHYVNTSELAGLLNVLYPGEFPNLAAYSKPPRGGVCVSSGDGVGGGAVIDADCPAGDGMECCRVCNSQSRPAAGSLASNAQKFVP